MKPHDLVFSIIYPACNVIDSFSLKAVSLLAGTAAVESSAGEYVIQTTFRYGQNIDDFKGALGVFQMEKRTHDDIVHNYLMRKPLLLAKVKAWAGVLDAKRLVSDAIYAAIFCRLHYLRVKEEIPSEADILGLANYWKRYYNTSLGAGTASRFVQCYSKVQEAVNDFATCIKK